MSLAVSTRGYFCEDRPLSIATRGYFCDIVVPEEPSGGKADKFIGGLPELRAQQLYEDEELLVIISAFMETLD